MSAPETRSQQISAFASIWYAAREKAGSPIPFKTDIPLRKLAPLMPKMSMLRPDEQGVVHYQLFGTRLAEEFGRDLTGTAVHSSMDVASASRVLAEFTDFYRRHGDATPWGRWVYATARSTSGRHIEYESLALPYLEEGAPGVRHMMYSLPLATLKYDEALDPCLIEHSSSIFSAHAPRPAWLHYSSPEEKRKTKFA
jgi:hypothetical protein